MKAKESEDKEIEEEEEEAEEAEAEEAEPVASESDNVGDASVEINVEALIQQIEVESDGSRLSKDQAAKRRLEELMEQKRAKRDLEDFEDYEI